MVARVLPPAEWLRLDGTLLELVWRSLDPRLSRVIVVEEDGNIVATTLLTALWHAECAWTRPDKRRSVSVGRALLRAIRQQLRVDGINEFLTMTTRVGDVPMGARAFGPAIKLEGDHYAVQVRS